MTYERCQEEIEVYNRIHKYDGKDLANMETGTKLMTIDYYAAEVFLSAMRRLHSKSGSSGATPKSSLLDYSPEQQRFLVTAVKAANLAYDETKREDAIRWIANNS